MPIIIWSCGHVGLPSALLTVLPAIPMLRRQLDDLCLGKMAILVRQIKPKASARAQRELSSSDPLSRQVPEGWDVEPLELWLCERTQTGQST